MLSDDVKVFFKNEKEQDTLTETIRDERKSEKREDQKNKKVSRDQAL